MKEYEVLIKMSAECESDAIELIQDYSGSETDIEILKIKLVGEH